MDTTTICGDSHQGFDVRAFWKGKAEAASAREIPDRLSAEQIAAATDAVKYVLIAFGVPDKFRAFIDAVNGDAEGSRDWVEAADIVNGQREREVTSRKITLGAIAKWTQRSREDLNEWPSKWCVTLIETMPGGQKGTTRYQTRY